MIKGMLKEGKLVPSELTAKLILKAISKSSNNKFLIDGFPRNDENREVWDRVVSDHILVILFDFSLIISVRFLNSMIIIKSVLYIRKFEDWGQCFRANSLVFSDSSF